MCMCFTYVCVRGILAVTEVIVMKRKYQTALLVVSLLAPLAPLASLAPGCYSDVFVVLMTGGVFFIEISHLSYGSAVQTVPECSLFGK